MPTADDLVNFGNSKGLELIPNEHVEVILNVPPYLEHHNPKIHDGFGDISFLGKYRLLAGNEEHGNYTLTSTLGTSLPTSHENTIGHAIAWNTAFQYHIATLRLWPELEINSTFWKDGKQDGRKQVFLTSGLVLGRFRLHGRLAMAVGVGFQIAATRYHTYDHATAITVRFPF